jgi:DNA-binding NarL/FixJ family response regulator
LDVLIVDDDFNARGGLTHTLRDQYPGASIYEAGSVGQAIEVLGRNPSISLVLLDLNVEDSRGIATLKTLKRWCEDSDCNPRLVIVSAAADYDDALIPEAIENCATGFITKGTSVEIFRSAIDLTVAGAIYIPEQYLRSTRRKSSAAESDEIAFTTREKQVAALLVQGLTYKQIARRLGQADKPMSDNTVRVHVQRIAWKLRVADDSSSDGLAAKAAVITAFAERRLRFALEP